jgi:pimeloyl-ACP methyl ester carboxylesterase
MTQPSFIECSGGRRLAFHLTEGRTPTVAFMGGFKSDMTGSKAMALEAFCREKGRRFLRFDYTGHGQSSGNFRDGTIGGWKQDALDMLDAKGGERIILAGSSMGAWLALLVALERKSRIAALAGIASAPDFTERLIWEKLDEKQKKELLDTGVFHAPSCYGEDPYPITRTLIEEGRNHLLLDRSIAVNVPVRLLHGTNDEDVPWQNSVLLSQRLSSPDVRLTLVKDGNHRLSEPEHLRLLCDTVESLASLND